MTIGYLVRGSAGHAAKRPDNFSIPAKGNIENRIIPDYPAGSGHQEKGSNHHGAEQPFPGNVMIQQEARSGIPKTYTPQGRQ